VTALNSQRRGRLLTPSLPQPLKISGLKVPTYTPPNSIFDDPITNLRSVLCILIEIPSRAHAKPEVKKSFNGLKFGTFIGLLPSDGAASTAVKGLSSGSAGPQSRKGGTGRNRVFQTTITLAAY